MYHPTISYSTNLDSNVYPDHYPVLLSDRRILTLPIVPLPNSDRAIALLMYEECSFYVQDELAALLVDQVRPLKPDIVVGVPSLGWAVARNVAGGLGFARYLPLYTTKKFWFDDPGHEMSSITSGGGKMLRCNPLSSDGLTGQRVVIVDDVVCTGGSMTPAIEIVEQAGGVVVGCACLLEETAQGVEAVGNLGIKLVSVGRLPILTQAGSSWQASL